MLPFHFSVLLLLIVVFHMDIVMSACPNCFGKADGCTATSAANCIWITGVTTNVAAIGTATTATLVLTKLLPGRVLRLFPRAVLQTIASLACKSSASAPVDIELLALPELRTHILSGDITSEEACLECMRRQDLLDETDANYGVKTKIFTTQISVLSTLKSRVHTNGTMEGTLLYILYRLSSVLCGKDPASFDVCIEIPTAGDTAEGGKRLTASVTRPHSLEQFMSLLNQYVLVCHTTGIANICAMSPFLDEVVYEPLRLGTLSWPVAFELLLIYLRIVDTQKNGCTVADVYASTGGIDAKRSEARANARKAYPDSIFRNLRGEPSRVAENTTGNPGNQGPELFKGQIKGFDKNCKKGCVAWNNGKSHLATHVGQNGVCKFYHGCNQYVTDKGPGGQCLDPNHTRANCTYDPAKKCSTPHRE